MTDPALVYTREEFLPIFGRVPKAGIPEALATVLPDDFQKRAHLPRLMAEEMRHAATEHREAGPHDLTGLGARTRHRLTTTLATSRFLSD